jgi:periplasmic copper chaperone A
MMHLRLLTVGALSALLIVPLARAESGIAVIAPYARVMGATAKSGAIFLTLENHGEADDRLIAVATDAAENATLHSNLEDASGMMQMVAIEGGIVLPARGMHALARGGDHIMLTGLTRPLADGDTFTLTLTFEAAGEVVVQVPVDNGRAPEAHDMEGMEDHSMP